MEYETNDQRQLLIYLSQEEWEAYGREAGYWPELVKEASAELQADATVETKEPTEVEILQAKVDALTEKIASMEGAVDTEEVEEETKEAGFNADNYPNLVAEQEQDGLIGPFTKTSPCV